MSKIRPLGDKILVERLEAEERTKGGIILPDNAREKPREGRIVAVGDGRTLDDGTRVKFTVKDGDRVIFASYAGTDIKHNGRELLILSEDDVLAVVE